MNPSMVLVIQLLAIGAIFYFLIIRPQGAARKKAEMMLSAIKKGDTVVTAGGIVGKVKDVKDTLLTIESGTSSLVVERARIVRVGDLTAPGQTS
jgi:preprotein translocase subunit YajC